MRDLFHVTLRHVASDTVIHRSLLASRPETQLAARFAMASETLRTEIDGGSYRIGLLMRIVTGEAAQFAVRCLVAFTELHRPVMLEQIRVPSGVRQTDDRNRSH